MSSRIALWLCSALGIMCPEVPLPSLDQMMQDAKKVNDISSEIDLVLEKNSPEYNELVEKIDQMRTPQNYLRIFKARDPEKPEELPLAQKMSILRKDGAYVSGSLAGDWHDFWSKQQVVIGNLFRKYFPTEDGSANSIEEKIKGIRKNLTVYQEHLAKKPEIGENMLSLADVNELLNKCLRLEGIVNSWYHVGLTYSRKLG